MSIPIRLSLLPVFACIDVILLFICFHLLNNDKLPILEKVNYKSCILLLVILMLMDGVYDSNKSMVKPEISVFGFPIMILIRLMDVLCAWGSIVCFPIFTEGP